MQTEGRTNMIKPKYSISFVNALKNYNFWNLIFYLYTLLINVCRTCSFDSLFIYYYVYPIEVNKTGSTHIYPVKEEKDP